MIIVTSKKEGLIKKIADRYSLRLLFLFGSQVAGKTHKESDYDFGYISEKNLDLEQEGRLINELIPIAEVKDERMINLVNIKRTTPLLLYAATSNCQILYEKEPDEFATLRAYAFKKYIEMKPVYKERARRLNQQIP